MTPPIFNLDDEVIITGKPVALDTDEFLGKRFTIDTIGKRHGETVFSDAYLPWYPASSLRLVEEELKIGDWVEIVGQPCGLERKPVGMTGKVLAITRDGNYELANWIYPASSLRKLTPEEVEQHEANEKCQIRIAGTIERCCERLSAIEKRLDDLPEKNDMWECIEAIEKRLEFVEAFQKNEVCDDCKPPEGQISVSIQRGKNEVHGLSYSECPMECLEWCKTVLDSMKKGGLRA